MSNFSQIFRHETLKNIFIYFTNPDQFESDTKQYNKICFLCGEKKAEQCRLMPYDNLLKECKHFEKFLAKEDEKYNNQHSI